MNLYHTVVKPFVHLTSSNDRKKVAGVTLLTIVGSLLDFFSLASFFPLLFALTDPLFVVKNRYANSLFHSLALSSTSSFIIVLTAGVFLFVLIKNLVSVWIVKVKTRYAFTFSNELSSKLLARYLSMEFSEFVKMDYVHQVNIIANYPLTLANNVIIAFTTLVSEIFVCLLIAVCIVWFDYKILVLISLIACPAFLFFNARKKTLKKINNDIKEVYPLTLKYATEVVEGFPEIKAYKKESYFYKRFDKASKRLSEIFIKDQLVETGTVRLTEIIAAVSICLLIANAVLREQSYQQTVMMLSIYAASSFRIIPSINRILHALQKIRTHEYLFEGLKPSNVDKRPSESNHNLVFENVVVLDKISFNYPDGLPILKNVSMTIRKGEKIAITGNSGEGKTTFLLVLLGFLRGNGSVIVDGEAVKHLASWQELISYVPQKPYILDGTLAENIAFGVSSRDINELKVLNLIRELDMEDVVRELPHGINTRIGERGARLSGGQLQRLAIARALYANTDIMILDEVTNQVHDSLELEILTLLDRLADKKKTIIMVTHKIVAKNFFDTIYMLEKGTLHKITAN